jgi:two-component sensor histidine kinase
MLAIVFVVLFAAMGVAYRLQRSLSRPILELAAVTRAVSDEDDYDVRVERSENDELTDLYRGFNAMLERIRQRERERDQALAAIGRAHDELEQRVAHRTEELTRANRLLLQQIGERQLAEQRLKASLSEKEVLLREIHHRVKNNLQVIYSLLSLQARDQASGPERDALEDSRQRVKTMALVHEALYRSDDLSGVDAPRFLRRLAEDMRDLYHASGRQVRLRVRVDELQLSLDQAIPVGLILNELLTNAFKYAFPAGGEGGIEVSLRRASGSELELAVADDGVGLPPGLDAERTGSLGLKVVAALAQQLKGRLEIGGGAGARFAIRFGLDRPGE